MQVCTTVEELRQARAAMSGRVALVPTMGALHCGHLAHLYAAREKADHVVVSVFVNPTQFGPHEDFDRYPRAIDVDVAKCETAGADLVFAPEVEAIYPPRRAGVSLTVPGVADGFEGNERPGHFEGVCRVVLKLFNLVRPDVATFGRKDYQQLAVVRAMVEDLMLPIEVVAVPTVREDDGLAMSSRNRYLDDEGRKRARGLSKALRQAQKMAEDGEPDPAAIEAMMRDVIRAHHIEVDYAAVRHATSLGELDSVLPDESVALVAGRVGGVRLLDNTLLGERLD
ncbi:MAG: pantoate--beta-alanine ligase [Planctomycetota bacterium]